jgi:hypothetical protein
MGWVYLHIIQRMTSTAPDTVIESILLSHNSEAFVCIIDICRLVVIVLSRISGRPELNLHVLFRFTTPFQCSNGLAPYQSRFAAVYPSFRTR